MESNNLSKNSNKESNEKESLDYLNKIKSEYILKKINQNLPKKKSLQVVQYNFRAQKRLNLNINDYKNYSANFSTIQIEIIPIANKYGKFINIPREAEQYYHIYFNEGNEENKRLNKNYIFEEDKAAKIIIKIDFQVSSLYELFKECDTIESINFKRFNRNNITNMAGMFFGCSPLKNIYFSKFNMENVSNIGGMFGDCSSIIELNLSNFNTDKVNNMSAIFYKCSSLKIINLSNFNTNNVKHMCSMFYDCSSLEEINLSNFNTDNVIDMSGMFKGCSSLKELNLSNFNTSKTKDMRFLFENCSSLKKLNLSNFNVGYASDTKGMFEGCSSLKDKDKLISILKKKTK